MNDEKREVSKVINGSAKTKKKSNVHKLVDIFLPEDTKSVKDHIVHDVMIPTAKRTIQDSIDILLNGEKTNRNNGNRASSRASYEKYYEKDKRDSQYSNRSRGALDFDDILFNTRGDAEAVLSELDELLSRYRAVSVMDLYSAAGLSCDYTFNKYGWRDLRNAEVVRNRDGDYVIKFPKATLLD